MRHTLVRPARALLNISREQLAHYAQVSAAQVRSIEHGIGVRGEAYKRVEQALVDRGIQFQEATGDKPGYGLFYSPTLRRKLG